MRVKGTSPHIPLILAPCTSMPWAYERSITLPAISTVRAPATLIPVPLL